MDIIIRDGDIINVGEQDILKNNKIKKVIVQEKILKPDILSLPYYKETNNSFETAVVMSGRNYGPRIDAWYSTGSITIPSSEISIDFTEANIDWVLYGRSVGASQDVSIDPLSIVQASGYGDTSQPYFDQSDVRFLGQYQNFSQTNKWGTNGKITYSSGLDSISYQDASWISVTKNNDNSHTINYKILTKIQMIYVNPSVISPLDPYQGKNFITRDIVINIKLNTVKVENEDEPISVEENGIGDTVSLETNALITKKTTISGNMIAQANAEKVLQRWDNGRESVSLDVIVGDYYDDNGNMVISQNTQGLPMLFNIGDVVVPYVKKASIEIRDGNEYVLIDEKPLSEANDGRAKRFIVYETEYFDDGVPMQRIKLIENSLMKSLTINIDEKTEIALIRITSPQAGAPVGEIDLDTGVIYLGDVIKINYSRKQQYSRGYYTQASLNGVSINSGAQFTVDGNWEIVAESSELTPYILTLSATDTNALQVWVASRTVRLYSGDTIYDTEILYCLVPSDEYIKNVRINGTVVYQNIVGNGFSFYKTVEGDLTIVFDNCEEIVLATNKNYVLAYSQGQTYTENYSLANAKSWATSDTRVYAKGSIKFYWEGASVTQNFEEIFILAGNQKIGIGMTEGGNIDIGTISDDIDLYYSSLFIDIPQDGTIQFINRSRDANNYIYEITFTTLTEIQ